MSSRGVVVGLTVAGVVLLGSPAAWAEDVSTSPSPSPSATVVVGTSPSATADVATPMVEEKAASPDSGPIPLESPSGDPMTPTTSVVAAAGAPDVSAGELDCLSWTLPLTLDNSTVPNSTAFTVRVAVDPGVAILDETHVVPALESKDVNVPIPKDPSQFTQFSVVVGVGTITLFSASVSCGPTATIGALDCAEGSLTLALDNTIKTTATTFTVTLTDVTFRDYPNASFVVPANSTRDVKVTVPDDYAVSVRVWAGNVLILSDGTSYSCVDGGNHQGAASIGDVDCSSQTVPVTLDNSLSAVKIDFAVATGNAYEFRPGAESEDLSTDHFAVRAGSTQVIHLIVPSGTYREWTIAVFDSNLANAAGLLESQSLASRTWPAVGRSWTAPIETGCLAADPTPSASVQAAELAKTGASGAPVAVGAVLLTIGGLLTWAAGPRRRR